MTSAADRLRKLADDAATFDDVVAEQCAKVYLWAADAADALEMAMEDYGAPEGYEASRIRALLARLDDITGDAR